MAVLKQRLHCKNSSGSYDTVYLENIATNIKMSESDTTLLIDTLNDINSNIQNISSIVNNTKANNARYLSFTLPISSWVSSTDSDGNNIWKQTLTISDATINSIYTPIVDSSMYHKLQLSGCTMLYFENEDGIIRIVATEACPVDTILLYAKEEIIQ